MKSLSLNGSDWTLTCYWTHQWKRRDPDMLTFAPALPPVSAVVPGAVHADLMRAGMIADWQAGLNAQKCEWINNRDWSLKRPVTVPADFDGQLTLECDGLDYSGTLLIDQQPAATFEGTHYRHRFDLTDHIRPGQTFELELMFDSAPRVDGVYGYTSRTRIFKPRFGYYWDWCARVVNVGIWQDVRLVSRGPTRFEGVRVLPRLNDDLSSGIVRMTGTVRGTGALRYELRDEGGRTVAEGRRTVSPGALDEAFEVDEVKLWWPATHGDQPLYALKLELVDPQGRVSDVTTHTIGFKRVRWLPNPDAPPGVRPYLCEVNGRSMFLRGVNWVPLSPLYGTVTPERYETYVRLYRNMNCNILRVWGGAILETEAFYACCDRLGLMVWQEFPLSSSGIDNWPPEDPEVIAELKRIAAEYIERRGHHACHILWCGGNELQGALDGGKVGIGRPVDESHPLMQEWAKLVERLDPGKRFLASSPSGPRFFAHREDFGRGLHHQTHGPWGNVPLAERYEYFNGDDSVFRSELGAPGCSSLPMLKEHCGDQSLWPPKDTNAHWMVPASAWAPWEDVSREFGPIADDPAELPKVVAASRYLQAESYRYAAEATRRRHPRCSGFLVWMGHDTMHCTSNNSVVQIDASTKPAYDWLQAAFAPTHISLRHDRIVYRPGERFVGRVWLCRDDDTVTANGKVTVRLRSLNGQAIDTMEQAIRGDGASIHALTVDWPVPAFDERLFVIELIWQAGETVVTNRYPLSQEAEHPLAPLMRLAPVQLTIGRKNNEVVVSNVGATAAIAVRVISARAKHALLTGANNVILFPAESASVRFERVCTADSPALQVEAFNSPTIDIPGR